MEIEIIVAYGLFLVLCFMLWSKRLSPVEYLEVLSYTQWMSPGEIQEKIRQSRNHNVSEERVIECMVSLMHLGVVEERILDHPRDKEIELLQFRRIPEGNSRSRRRHRSSDLFGVPRFATT